MTRRLNIGCRLTRFRSDMFALSLLLFSTLVVSCADDSGTSAQTFTSSVHRIHTEEELSLALKDSEERLLMIKFYADWCGPCRSLAPIIDKLSSEEQTRVNVYSVNVDENRQIARRYNVRGIPYVVFIRNQEVVDTLLGLHPEKSYRKVIDRLG